MNSDHSRLEAIAAAALDRADTAEREAFLAEACGGDEALLAGARRLLASRADTESFPAKPVSPNLPPTTAASTIAAPREVLGTVIGRYKLLQEIGEGGFGIVYLAEQREPVKRKVALKILKPGMDTREVVARFEAERQALALMDHPNIARVYDGGATESGRPFFVMELVKGFPLTKYCDDHQFTTRQRLDLFLDVLSAVQHAHQKGIIHRDLKPSNILVSPHDGKPVIKVIDFGIAKALSMELTQRTLFTGVGQMIGTPQYMSPEQAEVNALDVDTRSDLYSLGVILYELLTGRTPLDGKSLREAGYAEIQRLIREEQPTKPSTVLRQLHATTAGEPNLRSKFSNLKSRIPADLDWVVMKALEKDRTRRYETANAFAADIRRHLSHQPVDAGPPSARYRLTKFLRRNKGPVAATAAVIIALAAGAIVSVLQAARARDAEATAKRNEQDAIRERNESQASERRAVEQSEIASMVSAFLTEGLLKQGSGTEQANAGFEPMPHLTVHEAVRRAANKIEGSFTGKPHVEAAVRDAIADAFWGLGEWKDELPHRARALELRRAMPQPDTAEVARSLNNLARVQSDLGQFTEAYKSQEEAVAMWASVLGATTDPALLGRTNMAEMKVRQQDFKGALADFEAVLRDLKSVHPEGHPYTVQTLNNYSQAFFHTGKIERAMELQNEAAELAATVFGENHPTTLTVRHNLAMSLRMTGAPEKAIPLFEKALTAARKTLRPGHPDTLRLLDGLAWAKSETDQEDESLRLRKEAVDLAMANLGGKHSLTQHALLNYAADLGDGSRAMQEEAVPVLERLIESVGRGYGNQDLSLPILSRGNLAWIFRRLGRPADAVPVLTDALEIAGAKLGAEHDQTLELAESLSDAQTEAGDPDAAAKTLKEMLDSLEKGTSAWLRLVPKLCVSREKSGDPSTSEELRLEHCALLKKAHIEKPQDETIMVKWYDSLTAAVKNQMELGKPPAAEKLAREAIAANTGKPRLPDYMLQLLLGQALLAQDKYDEAETALLAAAAEVEDFRSQSDDPGAMLPGAEPVQPALTTLYEKWGRSEKKQAWEKRLSERQAAAVLHARKLLVSDDTNAARAVAAVAALTEEEAEKLVAVLVEKPLLQRMSAPQILTCVRALPQREFPLKRRLFARLAALDFGPQEQSYRDMGFAYGGYLEACAGDREACHRLLEAGLERYPESPRLHRYKGFAMLVMGDANAALAAFEELSARMKGSPPKPADLPLLLTGPIAAHWMAGAKDRAVEISRQLMAANSAFAISDYVASFNPVEPSHLPPPDSRALGEAIRETLRRHPALATPTNSRSSENAGKKSDLNEAVIR